MLAGTATRGGTATWNDGPHTVGWNHNHEAWITSTAVRVGKKSLGARTVAVGYFKYFNRSPSIWKSQEALSSRALAAVGLASA